MKHTTRSAALIALTAIAGAASAAPANVIATSGGGIQAPTPYLLKRRSIGRDVPGNVGWIGGAHPSAFGCTYRGRRPSA
jgi:hypothetical protein